MKEMVNRGEYFTSLTDAQKEAGHIKFNIPNEDNINSKNGEGVWGWVSPEDKEKWNDDNFHGKITAILLNTPLNYYPVLRWGTEVTLKCHGEMRPTLDPEWVKEYLM